jgi:hypothetical protein
MEHNIGLVTFPPRQLGRHSEECVRMVFKA